MRRLFLRLEIDRPGDSQIRRADHTRSGRLLGRKARLGSYRVEGGVNAELTLELVAILGEPRGEVAGIDTLAGAYADGELAVDDIYGAFRLVLQRWEAIQVLFGANRLAGSDAPPLIFPDCLYQLAWTELISTVDPYFWHLTSRFPHGDSTRILAKSLLRWHMAVGGSAGIC